jgi:hypothetical protein
MTVMSQFPLEDVNTRSRRPVRTGRETPLGVSAPVISHRTSTTATSGFKNPDFLHLGSLVALHEHLLIQFST